MQTRGIEALEELADARYALSMHGRYGDTTIGHLTPGEMVLPRPIADDPVLKRQLFDAFERHEINPYQYQVGHFENSINPLTGVPEFGFFKKIGKFFKKAAPIIGQVVGFAVGGPAGAAIGGGIGGAVKSGNLKGAVKGAAMGYLGGNVATGMGVTGGGGLASLWGQGTKIPGSPSMWTLGATPTDAGGIGGLFQNLGASGASALGFGTVPKGTLGSAWAGLSGPQKFGVGALGLAALGGLEGPKASDVGMPGPSGAAGGYLQNPLTGAVMPQYGPTAGSSVGGMGGAGAYGLQRLAGLDPATQAFLEAQRDEEDYSTLGYPEFYRANTANVKDGGAIKSPSNKLDPDDIRSILEAAQGSVDYSNLVFPQFRGGGGRMGYAGGGRTMLADGSQLPELDLRATGGSVSDNMGAGDVDTVDAKLADGEFVMTKQSVKGIGDGDHAKGIEQLYAMMTNNENKARQMGLGRA